MSGPNGFEAVQHRQLHLAFLSLTVLTISNFKNIFLAIFSLEFRFLDLKMYTLHADYPRSDSWSDPGAAVHCVHYIKQKDCTARFATEAIWEIPDKKLNQVAPATQAGLYRRGPLYIVYFLYGFSHTGWSVYCTGKGRSTVLHGSTDQLYFVQFKRTPR